MYVKLTQIVQTSLICLDQIVGYNHNDGGVVNIFKFDNDKDNIESFDCPAYNKTYNNLIGLHGQFPE